MTPMLTPVLALVCWTLFIWAWMYATRIPAMRKAKIDPQSAIHPGSLSSLPTDARVVADNYNHLHEQPTIFYALALYAHLAGAADPVNVWLAWAYVGLRIVHSFMQIVVRRVMLRFLVFATGSVVLILMAIRCVLAL
ncbi:MAG: MAPEG family protein [Parvularculaceae bacterium]|nr:MAPEG family protein [Parvularculaceae bacterium]